MTNRSNLTLASPPAQTEGDVEMDGSANNSSSFQTTATIRDGVSVTGAQPIPLPPIAPKKDRNLREFLGMMEEYAPIVIYPSSRSPFPPLFLRHTYRGAADGMIGGHADEGG